MTRSEFQWSGKVGRLTGRLIREVGGLKIVEKYAASKAFHKFGNN